MISKLYKLSGFLAVTGFLFSSYFELRAEEINLSRQGQVLNNNTIRTWWF